MMTSLQVLCLAGNNFMCNCAGLQLKQIFETLSENNIIKDFHQIICFVPKRHFYTLPDSKFGCPCVILIVSLTFSLSFLPFLVTVVFVVYVFRYYIRLFLFIQFGWRFFYTYTQDETLYDVFISYSSKKQ